MTTRKEVENSKKIVDEQIRRGGGSGDYSLDIRRQNALQRLTKGR